MYRTSKSDHTLAYRQCVQFSSPSIHGHGQADALHIIALLTNNNAAPMALASGNRWRARLSFFNTTVVLTLISVLIANGIEDVHRRASPLSFPAAPRPSPTGPAYLHTYMPRT